MDYWTFRWQYTSEVVTATELTEFGQLPVVIAINPHPAGVATEVPEVMTCDLLEDGRHIAHVVQRIKLFDVEPLLSSAMYHGVHEGLTVLIPLPITNHWADLVGVVATDNMQKIPLPSRGCVVIEVVHRSVTDDTLPPFMGSSSGGPVSPIRRRFIP